MAQAHAAALGMPDVFAAVLQATQEARASLTHVQTDLKNLLDPVMRHLAAR